MCERTAAAGVRKEFMYIYVAFHDTVKEAGSCGVQFAWLPKRESVCLPKYLDLKYFMEG